ncbi:MAG: hypothetical protein LBL08_00160 [Candidatus Nomurabacteria bacterium]|jgi:hypothetical protein|nr:hypothetical protein [Candidatus Nomurabacteria bacterium]
MIGLFNNNKTKAQITIDEVNSLVDRFAKKELSTDDKTEILETLQRIFVSNDLLSLCGNDGSLARGYIKKLSQILKQVEDNLIENMPRYTKCNQRQFSRLKILFLSFKYQKDIIKQATISEDGLLVFKKLKLFDFSNNPSLVFHTANVEQEKLILRLTYDFPLSGDVKICASVGEETYPVKKVFKENSKSFFDSQPQDLIYATVGLPIKKILDTPIEFCIFRPPPIVENLIK